MHTFAAMRAVPMKVKKYPLLLIMIHIVSRKLYAIPLKSKNMEHVASRAQVLLQQARNDGLGIHTIETDGGGEFKSAFDRMLLRLTAPPHAPIRHDRPTGTSPQDMASMKSMAHGGKEKSMLPSGAGDHNYNALIERANQTMRYLLMRFAEKHEGRFGHDKSWETYLAKALKMYNATYHTTVQEAPQEAVDQGYDHLTDISEEMRERADDQKRKLHEAGKFFNIGDIVQLKQNLTNSTRSAEILKKKAGVYATQVCKYVIVARRGQRYLIWPTNTMGPALTMLHEETT